MTKSRDLNKLLNDVRPKWLCPVTGKQFDADDESGIEAHKALLMQREEERKIQEKTRKITTEWRKLASRATTLTQFLQTCTHYIQQCDPALNVAGLTINVLEIADGKHLIQSKGSMAPVVISGVSPKIKTVLGRILTKKLPSVNKTEFVFDLRDVVNNAALTKALHDFYRSPIRKKLDDNERQDLRKNDKEYAAILDNMASLRKVIHQHRAEIRNLDEQAEKIRSKVVAKPVFNKL